MIDILLPTLAGVNLFVCVVVGIQLYLGNRTVQHLKNIEPAGDPLPKVSVIVTARNEERNIEAGVRSLLELDYVPLDILVVNDRSTDRTGEILDQISNEFPSLRVVHLNELPAGWMGKNHALSMGAEQADGEFILFTDADVVMQPSTLRRAMRYVLQNNIDHLPMLFRVEMPTWLMECFVIVFSLYFWVWFRPWKAKDPDSKAHVGAGGFNLIRSTVYHTIGGYEAIRLRPDDDIKLGKLVKIHGHRQDVLIATDHIKVPWYASLGELVHGLEKNAFSGTDYNIPLTVTSSMVALLFHVFPFVGILITTGITWWLYLGVVCALLLMCWLASRNLRNRWTCFVGFPLAVLMFVWIQWRTMFLNHWYGGIRWRETLYPLAELKSNKL